MNSRLSQIYQELARRRLYERIRYFQPHGGQEEFIRLLADPEAFIVVSGAGNGWGKSELLVAIYAAIMWPQLAAPCFAHPALLEWRHPKRARIYSKPAELEEIGSLQTAIAKLFPRGRYTPSKSKYGYPSVFKTDTGWRMDLFSYERDHAEAAGPNIGLQAFNEPPPQPLWKEALARTRSGGIIIGAMTSLQDNPWVVDGIFDKADGKKIKVRFGDVEENCVEHGRNGTLRHAQIETILSQFDADEREARKTGKPLIFSGRIYKTFDRAAHVREFDVPDESVSHGMVVDPAIGKPLACAWRFVDRAGVLHYYDESPNFEFQGAKDSNLTVGDYAAIFREKEGAHRIDTRILDRHFGNARRTLGGLTLRQEFGEPPHNLEFRDSYTMDPQTEVEQGILRVKDYLKYDKSKPMDGLNRPKIVIHPRCTNLIAAFERWGRNPRTGKPNEEFKDFMDLVRYDVMSDPAVETAQDWSGGSKPFYGISA